MGIAGKSAKESRRLSPSLRQGLSEGFSAHNKLHLLISHRGAGIGGAFRSRRRRETYVVQQRNGCHQRKFDFRMSVVALFRRRVIEVRLDFGYALSVAMIAPLLSNIISGMPAVPMLYFMLVELIIYAAVLNFIKRKLLCLCWKTLNKQYYAMHLKIFSSVKLAMPITLKKEIVYMV